MKQVTEKQIKDAAHEIEMNLNCKAVKEVCFAMASDYPINQRTYEIDNVKIHTFIVYKGKFSHTYDIKSDVEKLVTHLGFKSVAGNDAPRGGRIGDYLIISD